MAYLNAKEYEKAKEMLNQSLSINPESITPYLILASCYVRNNEIDKAKYMSKKVLEIDPNFSVEYHNSFALLKDQEALERYIGSLRKAGLPD
jgi:Tfp pilus assembly protein PilF